MTPSDDLAPSNARLVALTFHWLELAGVGLARLHFWLQFAVLSPCGGGRNSSNPLKPKYPGWDSNPHGGDPPQDFKSCASANFATRAWEDDQLTVNRRVQSTTAE